MTITLPLEPDQEAKLIALAKEKGISHDGLVREAIEKLIGEAQDISSSKEPTRSLRGLLAKYGPAPSAEEIDKNRTEMFANFPSSDF